MGFVGPYTNIGDCYNMDEVSENGGVITLKRAQRRRRRRVRLSRKFYRLQRLIPGGQGLQPDRLMAQTAGYIMHLRLQLCVLEALLKLHD